MNRFLEELQSRGMIQQHSAPFDELSRVLDAKGETGATAGYIGFDPTADSLHVGHLVSVMGLRHFQDAGHRPIAVIGGGTALVGDPSGKSESRPMLTEEDVARNGEAIQRQLARLLRFDDSPNGAVLVNNADWLREVGYIAFLRDVGRYVSVSRMLSQESVKLRLAAEQGLTFLEFNYMLLQAYDFVHLNRTMNCVFQFGGDDQWGNIVTGSELIHKINRRQAFALTFPLLTTATGAKMGKTEKGAVWLDPARTSPYEFFQYWRNVDDRDVVRMMRIFTLMGAEEIGAHATREGQALNESKERLAFEVTKLVHGEAEATAAMGAAQAAFAHASGDIAPDAELPTSAIAASELEGGIGLLDALAKTGLAASKSDARRLVAQGGVYINGVATDDAMRVLFAGDMNAHGQIILRVGKKKYHRLIVT